MGAGAFARTDYPTGAIPHDAAIGDIDADGHLDIAVANEWDNTIGVLRGRGDGTFEPARYGAGQRPSAIWPA